MLQWIITLSIKIVQFLLQCNDTNCTVLPNRRLINSVCIKDLQFYLVLLENELDLCEYTLLYNFVS